MFIALWKQWVIYWICSVPLISTNASRETSWVLFSHADLLHEKNSLVKIDFNSLLEIKHLALVKEAHNPVLYDIWTASVLEQGAFSLLSAAENDRAFTSWL